VSYPKDQCIITGKDKYEIKDKALEMAGYLSMTTGVQLSVYYCGHCNSWHLTKRRNK